MLNKLFRLTAKEISKLSHYNDVIMGEMVSQITSLTIVHSTIYSGADQRKHQSSASLAFVQGIHQWLVNSPHRWPEMQKMFPFDNVIMYYWNLMSSIHWSKMRGIYCRLLDSLHKWSVMWKLFWCLAFLSVPCKEYLTAAIQRSINLPWLMSSEYETLNGMTRILFHLSIIYET